MATLLEKLNTNLDMNNRQFEGINADLQAEEKCAKWIRVKDLIQCSNCGFGMFPQGAFFRNGVCEVYQDVNFRPKFCLDCGAIMSDKGEKVSEKE